MKIVLCTVTAAVGVVLLLAGWSAGGRLMNVNDDGSVLKGVVVRALVVGAVLWGLWYAVGRVMAMDGSVQKKGGGNGPDKCCR